MLALAVLPAMAVWLSQTAPAKAHPHVWVTVESTVLFGPNRQITGIRQKWTFDELYSSFAVQGLDKKGGSNPTREDLKELADTNVESLKEFGYFTFPQATRTEPTKADPKAAAAAAPAAPEKAPVAAPIDYYLEYNDGLLSLHFSLPLEKAVGVDGQAFGFAVYDPSYFIAFQYAKEKPVQLGPGAPADCMAALQQPGAEAAKADRLADAFSKALGPGSGIAVGADQAVVACKGKP